MKKIIFLILIALMTGCNLNNNSKNNEQKKIDSLATVINKLKKEKKLDSLKKDSLRKDSIHKDTIKKKSANASTLTIPFFINWTSQQISNYWSTRVSSDYFFEEKNIFGIQVENPGSILFMATFDNNGLCKEHYTLIGMDDFSVMKARLMKAGYIYYKDCDCWKLSGANHFWTIEPIGVPLGKDNKPIEIYSDTKFELKCTRQ